MFLWVCFFPSFLLEDRFFVCFFFESRIGAAMAVFPANAR